MLWKKLEGQPIDYRWRPLSDTSQNLVRSVVTAEDAGICSHNGVEWAVLGDVISEAMQRDGGPTRGGSQRSPSPPPRRSWPMTSCS